MTPPCNWATFATVRRKKSILTGRKCQHNQAQGGAAVCCDRLEREKEDRMKNISNYNTKMTHYKYCAIYVSSFLTNSGDRAAKPIRHTLSLCLGLHFMSNNIYIDRLSNKHVTCETLFNVLRTTKVCIWGLTGYEKVSLYSVQFYLFL